MALLEVRRTINTVGINKALFRNPPGGPVRYCEVMANKIKKTDKALRRAKACVELAAKVDEGYLPYGFEKCVAAFTNRALILSGKA
jgi:hypothetical protein